jgi:hypothetical protein
MANPNHLKILKEGVMPARAIIRYGKGKLIDPLHHILVSTEAARFAFLQPGGTL